MSYKVGVKTKTESNWVFNGLRFGHGGTAHEYGTSLMKRWPDVVAFEVQSCIEPANCTLPVPTDRYAVKREPAAVGPPPTQAYRPQHFGPWKAWEGTPSQK